MPRTVPVFADLFDLSSSLAAPLLARYDGSADFFSLLAEFILEVGPELPCDWDEIAENVWVGSGTVISSSALLRGPAIIGRGVEIKHGAAIWKNVLIGDSSWIGNETEISSSLLFPEVRLSHRNFVSRGILGRGVRFGAGAVQGGWSMAESGKFAVEVLVGDGTVLGDNSVLLPGVVLGADSLVEPLAAVEGGIPPRSRVFPDGRIMRREAGPR